MNSHTPFNPIFSFTHINVGLTLSSSHPITPTLISLINLKLPKNHTPAKLHRESLSFLATKKQRYIIISFSYIRWI